MDDTDNLDSGFSRRDFLGWLGYAPAVALAVASAGLREPTRVWHNTYATGFTTEDMRRLVHPNQWIVTYASGQSQIVRWDSETTGLALGGASVHTIKPAVDSATGVCG